MRCSASLCWCLGLSLLLVATAALAAQPTVLFGPPVGDEPNLADGFIEFLSDATRSLDCCFFELSNTPVTNALLAAAKRGVKVRFVTDDARYFVVRHGKKVPSELRGPVKLLVDAGIQVIEDRRTALMHNKFCIKDGTFLWTGSYNLTDSCTLTNYNNALWVESPELAAVYRKKFAQMWDGRLFGPARPSDVAAQRVSVGGRRYEVLFAPEDGPNARVLEVVQDATHEIYFMLYAFTDDPIGQALVEKKVSGLRVGGLLDGLLFRSTGPTSEFAKMTQAGVDVSIVRPKGGGLVHNKVFIIDPHTDHGVVVMGSLNISTSGSGSNDENTLVIHDSAVALQYFREYERRRVQFSGDIVAGVLVSDPPVAGATIPKAQVHLVTNGRPVKTVSIDFPARWRMDPLKLAGARIFRGQEDITSQVTVDYKAQRMVLHDVGLTAQGDARSLVLEVQDLFCPPTAGVYSLYVRVGFGDKDVQQMLPIREQPTIEVFKAAEAASLEERLEGLSQLLARLPVIDRAAATPEQQRKVLLDYQSAFASLEYALAGQAMDGAFDDILKVVAYAEQAKDPDSLIYQAVIARLSRVRKIVVSAAINQGDESARQLAERMDRVCRSEDPDLSPLSPR